MHRKVVAYWHDSEGTLVAGCDDGTTWEQYWDGWLQKTNAIARLPVGEEEEYPVDTRYREIVL